MLRGENDSKQSDEFQATVQETSFFFFQFSGGSLAQQNFQDNHKFFYLDAVSLLMSSPDNLLNKLARTPVDNNKRAIR